MTQSPSTEELLVRVLLHSLREALRSRAPTPAAGEPPAAESDEIARAFASVWRRVPVLELDVAPDGIRWSGLEVLTGAEDDVELGATLYRSGIRQVAFEPGAETEEVSRFLSVLDRKMRLDPGGDLDLVTTLFREDFRHVRYAFGSSAAAGVVPERPVQPSGPGPAPLGADVARPTPAARVREAVRRETASATPGRGVVRLEEFDSTLYFLDESEIEYLRTSIDREYEADHARNALALLLDILELQPETAVRTEVIHVLTTLLPYLMGTGRFDAVAYLTGEIRALTRSIDFAPEHREALGAMRSAVSETRAVAQLFHALDAGEVEPDPEQLGILLRELRPEALRTVLVWVGQLRSPRAKAALMAAIEGFFTEWPTTLARMLDAPDRTVVHRALGIAERLRLPGFIDPVVSVLGSDDPATRRLAAGTLAAIGTAPAFRGVVRLVDDPDPDVRRTVYEALAARPFRGALEPLDSAIGGRELESRELGERRALFEAYGAVAGPHGVSALEGLLRGRGALGRRPSSETRACAAVALGRIGTPHARLALEKATRERDPVVRSAAASALREAG